MKPKLKAAALLLAMGLPFAMANAQTTPNPDPHHPDNQATGTPPAAGQPAAPSPTTPPSPGAGPTAPQMGMMMGDMRQMMQMMQQMMQMMGGGGGTAAGAGGMTGGNVPMTQMMPGGPGISMGMGGLGAMRGTGGGAREPMMFRHTEGVLAFYKAELRITEAQTPQWNAFADAVRSGAKAMRDAMQRASTQRAVLTAPEQIDRRVALLTAALDAAKVTAGASKALYAALNPEQRKLADSFMSEHMRGMRGMMP